jgi:hypothetical protein
MKWRHQASVHLGNSNRGSPTEELEDSFILISDTNYTNQQETRCEWSSKGSHHTGLATKPGGRISLLGVG